MIARTTATTPNRSAASRAGTCRAVRQVSMSPFERAATTRSHQLLSSHPTTSTSLSSAYSHLHAVHASSFTAGGVSKTDAVGRRRGPARETPGGAHRGIAAARRPQALDASRARTRDPPMGIEGKPPRARHQAEALPRPDDPARTCQTSLVLRHLVFFEHQRGLADHLPPREGLEIAGPRLEHPRPRSCARRERGEHGPERRAWTTGPTAAR